jgi:hypothetical protein
MGGWRKLHNEELHDLYSLPRMGWCQLNLSGSGRDKWQALVNVLMNAGKLSSGCTSHGLSSSAQIRRVSHLVMICLTFPKLPQHFLILLNISTQVWWSCTVFCNTVKIMLLCASKQPVERDLNTLLPHFQNGQYISFQMSPHQVKSLFTFY